jgi:hypothetical protein
VVVGLCATLAMVCKLHVEAVEGHCKGEGVNAEGSCTSSTLSQQADIFDLFGDWMMDRRKEAEDFMHKIFTSGDKLEEDVDGSWSYNIPESQNAFENIFGSSSKEEGEKIDKGGQRNWFDDLGDLFRKAGDPSDEKRKSVNEETIAPTFTSILQSMMKGGTEETAAKLIEKATEMASGFNAEDQGKNFMDVFQFLKDSFDEVVASMERNMSEVGSISLVNDWPFMVASFMYYIEHTDELKNPSWKRRKHRFHPTVQVKEIDALHEDLFLADTSYANSKEKVKERLGQVKTPWELVYSQLEAQPNQPAHFIALKRGASGWSKNLEILLVIRGTKQIGDFLSDALLDAVDYRGGKCHSGIMLGGQYIAEKHLSFFRDLLELSDKTKIKLTILGHSLGAGMASVAGIEFNDHNYIDAKVIGFGCPALLSKELSESTKSFITTVVADSDVVPRMSAASICNTVLNMISFDWSSKAIRDIKELLLAIKSNVPFPLPDDLMEQVLQFVNRTLEDKIQPQRRQIPDIRKTPILIPPGICVHFYRDGVGVSGTYTPCDFFDELDITRTLVDDHFIPTGYHTLFLQLMRQHHNDQNFAFWNDIQEDY